MPSSLWEVGSRLVPQCGYPGVHPGALPWRSPAGGVCVADEAGEFAVTVSDGPVAPLGAVLEHVSVSARIHHRKCTGVESPTPSFSWTSSAVGVVVHLAGTDRHGEPVIGRRQWAREVLVVGAVRVDRAVEIDAGPIGCRQLDRCIPASAVAIGPAGGVPERNERLAIDPRAQPESSSRR